MKIRAKSEPDDVSEFTDKGAPMWVPDSVIRHRESGQELLVVHVYRNCTVVVDLHCTANPTPIMVLLQRDYGNWARDTDMENADGVNYDKEWRYNPITM